MRLLLINGPNLNLLGQREPSLYGTSTLVDIENQLRAKAEAQGVSLDCFQSNFEGALIDRIQEAIGVVSGILINAGGFTHTSIALLDALRSTSKPKIEVHISNIYAREDYRRKSVTSEAVNGVICGFGENGYILAIDAIKNLIYSKD